ncbi:hypothetical protein EJC49_03765 [Aquibium carbonis]|uniref:Uncharacterized protein n=1 Tax=Aquibium carbonis TaxID=2495581 RepID=A0A3S0AUY5_9HYPH|nr:hypothetical protein [Aquibium carbonis]RST87738.1 hypothetical protein EJC49_03765 [Aquibium carbonis]
MPQITRSPELDAIVPGEAAATPICFVTEDGATGTITLDAADASPTEALVKAKDAIRCLAEAFGRAERRVPVGSDETGAVFRSWAYRA